jgi:hypothetical protein
MVVGYSVSGLQNCRVAVEPSARRQSGEVSAGIFSRLTPPLLAIQAPGKGGLRLFPCRVDSTIVGLEEAKNPSGGKSSA